MLLVCRGPRIAGLWCVFVSVAQLGITATAEAQWAVQPPATDVRLRGLGVVDADSVWASGSRGTFLRTVDGGRHWTTGVVPGASELDFRDLHAWSADTACLLSIGPGASSRIYRTGDGGRTWGLSFRNPDPKGFLDALAFWDDEHGLALGDPVDGRFMILTTDDGGKSWRRISAEGMPPALPGEGAFAASGTCLVVAGRQSAWFATGGASASRAFRSADRGRHWSAHETPIQAGSPSSGIFSLAFRDPEHGVAVGGDYKHPDVSGRFVARTSDGGKTWALPMNPHPRGYRSAVAFLPASTPPTLVAVGPTGADLSVDDGASWTPIGRLGFDSVGFTPGGEAGWASGELGAIAKLPREALAPAK